MKYTKDQYLENMEGYFGPDEEVSNQVLSLVKTRMPHQCMGVEHEGDDEIPPQTMAICEKAIHVDSGRVSCYVCIPCADKWLDELLEAK